MNFKTLADWVSELDKILGGADVTLRASHLVNGMTIRVMWLFDVRYFEYEQMLSLGEIEYINEFAQQCVLDSITHKVQRMLEVAKSEKETPK